MKGPRATPSLPDQAKGLCNPRWSLWSPLPRAPPGLDGRLELDGDGPKGVAGGEAGRVGKVTVFLVSGRDVPSAPSEMCPVLLGGSQPLFWDVACSGLALDGLLPTPRTI